MRARIERRSGVAVKNLAFGWRVEVHGAEPRQVPDIRTAEEILALADAALYQLEAAT